MQHNYVKYFWQGTLLIVMAFVTFHFTFRDDPWQNAQNCATKRMAIKGVITYTSGRPGFRTAQVNNIKKPVYLNVHDELSRNKFAPYHFFGVGDSIIKAANSNEVTVKNQDSVVVFTIGCYD
jgi:hypothetical protein